MAKTKLAIAADHAGFELKEFLRKNISEVEWTDLGPANTDRVDYPDFAEKAARLVSEGKLPGAVLVCGSGVGMAISANKIKGIRATIAESETIARLSKEHNNVNVLCLGARVTPEAEATKILRAWLNASFEGGRHQGRVDKISKLER